MKKSVSILAALMVFVLGFGALLVLLKNRNSGYRPDMSLAYIEAKVSQKPICEGMTPVVIFQYNGAGAVNSDGVEEINSFLAGSGTMVVLSNGLRCVITSEHLFTTQSKVNYDCPMFAVKELRTKSKFAIGTLADARPFFVGKPGVVDIAICTVIPKGDIKIKPFSPFQGGDGEGERSSEHNLCAGKPEDMVIRSLVSGETARLLCMDKIPGAGDLHYYLTDYQCVPGESGTGFVDRYGRLFILKATIAEVAEVNKQLKIMGVIDRDIKGFSVVVGALAISK